MGRTILIWGLVGGVIVAVLMQLSPGRSCNDHMNPLAMWLGYLTMLIALSTILLGIKQYRDQVSGGVITFWRGLAHRARHRADRRGDLRRRLGGLPGHQRQGLHRRVQRRDDRQGRRPRTPAPPKLAEIRAQAAQFQAIYDDPLLRFPMTMVEMLPVGVLVALVSAFLLRFPGFLPAREPIGAQA